MTTTPAPQPTHRIRVVRFAPGSPADPPDSARDGTRVQGGVRVKAAALEEYRADWFADARLAILRLAITEQEFTADTLRKVLRPAPHQNWPGLAFGQARRAGIIEPVTTTTSTSKSRNHGSLKVWRAATEGAQ